MSKAPKKQEEQPVEAFYVSFPSKHVLVTRDMAGNVFMQGVSSQFGVRTAAHGRDKTAFPVSYEKLGEAIAEAGFKQRPAAK